MSPDGESIVTGAGDETLRFWRVFSKQQARRVSNSMSIILSDSCGVLWAIREFSDGYVILHFPSNALDFGLFIALGGSIGSELIYEHTMKTRKLFALFAAR